VASNNDDDPDFWRIVRRILVLCISLVLLGFFVLWRIDNPRAEKVRMAVVDRVSPVVEWTVSPLASLGRLLDDFQSYNRVYEQNQELRRELQRMRGWREAALQLEQKNSQLRALNNVKLSPHLSFVTGEVLTDSGSPFSRSGLINVGRQDGIADGSAAMDGLGVVGRVSGIGETSARIIFLTDTSSQIPVVVMPTRQKGILTGDNSGVPLLQFLEDAEAIQPGDRVVTSGDGGVFPVDLLVGQVAIEPDGRVRVRLAADYNKLDFIRIIRPAQAPNVTEAGGLVGNIRPPLLHEPDREKY
jgi:rod shape-determining protein MreC